MSRTCIYCETQLPEPTGKGHRRREFCSNACKQKHHRWHNEVRGRAGELTEPFWKVQYQRLLAQHKFLEERLKKLMDDLAGEHEIAAILEDRNRYYEKQYETLLIDYKSRLQGLGMSEKDIAEFDTYWQSQYDFVQETQMMIATRVLSKKEKS